MTPAKQPGLLHPPGLGRHEPLRPVRSDPTAQLYPAHGQNVLMRACSGDQLRVGAKQDGNQHKKLERQLSLKGVDDPRLKAKGPTFHFHDPSYPSSGPGGWQGAGQEQGVYLPPQAAIPPGLYRQLMQRNLADQMRAKQTLPVPELYDQHVPVGRMASAPEFYSPASQRQRSPTAAEQGGARTIQRNSSSSDSNLSVLSEGAAGFNQSVWSFPGSFISPATGQPGVAPEYQLFGAPSAAPQPPQTEEPPRTGRITPGACRPGSEEQLSLHVLQQQLHEHKRLIENIKENMSWSSENVSGAQSRSQLYYHLCGLFAENKVQAVMAAYPGENDPKVLCAILLNS